MPYYSKTGDKGSTCVTGAGRTGKDDLRVEALGNFDELSSALGVAAAFSKDKATRRTLENIQNDIHTVCSEISSYASKPGKAKCVISKKSLQCKGNLNYSAKEYPRIMSQHVRELEEAISRIEAAIGQQHSFLIPGGTKEASLIHLARTVARRAERSLVRLSREALVREELLSYANRLSSLLWVLARLQNKIHNEEEFAPKYRYQRT